MAEETTSELIDRATREAIEAKVSRADIDAMLSALPDAGGPAGLTLDENGVGLLDDGQGRPITVMHRPGFSGIYLSAPVIEMEETPPGVLLAVLEANAVWAITKGGTFACIAPGEPVLFCQCAVLPKADPSAGLAAILDFARAAEEWEEKLRAFADSLDDPSPEATPQPHMSIEV